MSTAAASTGPARLPGFIKMANGDSKFRSRKFILAVFSFAAVSTFAAFGTFELAKDAGDIALIIGSWGTSNATILGLYNYANWKTGGE